MGMILHSEYDHSRGCMYCGAPARLVSPADREGPTPYSATDEAELREDIGNDYLVGKYDNDVARRLLATLDAARLGQREDAPLDARIRGYREGRASVWEELVEYVNEARDNADRIVAETDGPLPTADDVRGILAREGQGA